MGTMAAKMCKQEYQQVFINSTRGPSLKGTIGYEQTKHFDEGSKIQGRFCHPSRMTSEWLIFPTAISKNKGGQSVECMT